MKIILAFFLLCSVSFAAAAQTLSNKDLNNLVALSMLYSKNNMFKGDDVAKAANALRTPVLSHVIDVLIAHGKGDTCVLNKNYLSRPDNNELKLWYVIREIHYDQIDTTKKPSPAIDVAKATLAKNINEQWLVENYYHMSIVGGIAMLFNDADLSKYNFDLDSLGLKNEQEKAVFFLRVTDGLIRGRFLVLSYMKNNERIAEFVRKLPTFNGRQYFYFTNFNLNDADWVGYYAKESYMDRNIGDFLNTLYIQVVSAGAVKMPFTGREVYFNSILHHPEYFKYSKDKDSLQKIYDGSK